MTKEYRVSAIAHANEIAAQRSQAEEDDEEDRLSNSFLIDGTGLLLTLLTYLIIATGLEKHAFRKTPTMTFLQCTYSTLTN